VKNPSSNWIKSWSIASAADHVHIDRQRGYDFNSLKEIVGVTDGSMASHMKALEKENIFPFQNHLSTASPIRGTRQRKKDVMFLKGTWMPWSCWSGSRK